MDRESREGRSPRDGDVDDDLKLSWGESDDRWTDIAGDRGGFSPRGDRGRESEPSAGVDDVPWDELAEDSPPQFESSSFAAERPKLVPDDDEDDEDDGPTEDDESPPHGDPLDPEAEEAYEPRRPPASRMDTLQDALASIRERVQTLSGSTRPGGVGGTSQLALYRAATEDRTLAELKRHSRDTEDLLRRMSALMQDLSLDLRSIVDAARRAIDQTSEHAESSIELGRLLGDRIEQMDSHLSARIEVLEGQKTSALDRRLGKRVDQIDAAIGTLQVHLDKRLSKLEQRAGVGVLREEVGEVRADLGEVKTDLGDMRANVTAVRTDLGGVRGDLDVLRDEVLGARVSGSAELEQRLDVVGTQLDRTLTLLRDVMEGSPDQEEEGGGVAAVIRNETEAAMEPLRAEVEELSRQLGAALDREEQLGATLSTLTDEVQRLRKRMPVRAGSSSTRRQREPEPEPEPEPEVEFDEEVEPEPEPAPAPRRRARPVRAKRATAKKAAPEPDYELDINEPFAPGELDIDDSHLDVEPEEEPIRRARGTKKKGTTRTLAKGRRTRSSSR